MIVDSIAIHAFSTIPLLAYSKMVSLYQRTKNGESLSADELIPPSAGVQCTLDNTPSPDRRGVSDDAI